LSREKTHGVIPFYQRYDLGEQRFQAALCAKRNRFVTLKSANKSAPLREVAPGDLGGAVPIPDLTAPA
jgi:hypothetical protein